MKNKMIFFKILIKYIVTFILLIVIFFAFSVITCTLPDARIKKNIEKSLVLFERDGEDLSEQIIYNSEKYYAFDDFAEILFLQKNYYVDRNKIIESAMLNHYWLAKKFYRHEDLKDQISDNPVGKPRIHARYWNGNTFLVRVLLIFADYHKIRWFYWAVSSIILLLFFLIIYKKTDIKVPLIFLISLLAVNYFTTQFSMQLSIGFNIAFIFSIIISVLPEQKKRLLPILFFIFGALTQYFDFNTVPIASLGIPLVTYLVLNNKQNFKQLFTKIILFSFLWGFSFLLSWVAKWGLTTILTDHNCFKEAINVMFLRINPTHGNERLFLFDVIKRNILGLSYWLYLIIASIMFIFSIISFRKEGIKLAVIFLIIATMPYIYYCLLPNAVYLHYWFMYRMQIVTMLSFLFIFNYLINWDRLKEKSKKIFTISRKTNNK